MKKINVPIIMYHSIGIQNQNWKSNYLTCPYEIFEDHLKWLKNKGFQTISLQNVYDHMAKRAKLPKNPVVLTFDDGYLDNWVFVYPLLKKYGFCGTVYISPEFVDNRDLIRKNLDGVWKNDLQIDNLQISGYLSWKEIKEMEKKNIIDIQSHTMSHTQYFKGNKIIDFRHPGDSYIWMTWNENPAYKPYLQTDNEELVNYGEPVYEYGRAISVRRFFPDKNLNKFLLKYVKNNGGKDFFQSENWRDILFKITCNYKEKNKIFEEFETEEEYKKRIQYELEKSKDILEKKLSKDIKFLCWPGGDINEEALKIALDLGYTSSTAGQDMKNQRKYLKNRFGEDPSRINRIGSILYWNRHDEKNRKVIYKNGFYLILSLYRFQERKIIAPLSSIILKGRVGLYKIKYEVLKIR